MNEALAVITVVGVLVTILANLTNIARFFSERREKRTVGVSVATATTASNGRSWRRFGGER